MICRTPKIALCRECKGTGILETETPQRFPTPCPQCNGSGRVLVSCKMAVDIKPYIPKPQKETDNK